MGGCAATVPLGGENNTAQPRERLGGCVARSLLDLAVVVAESDIDFVSDPQRSAEDT